MTQEGNLNGGRRPPNVILECCGHANKSLLGSYLRRVLAAMVLDMEFFHISIHIEPKAGSH